MRIKMIEFEATGEELKTNRTLLEALSDAVASIMNSITDTPIPLPEEDEKDDADEDDA